MSAENAWRIAMEAAGERCWTIDDCFRSLPMPPAFRAEVEAEAGELREVLGRLVEALDNERDGGSRPKRSPMRSMATARARALLSRLEAKGESHE